MSVYIAGGGWDKRVFFMIGSLRGISMKHLARNIAVRHQPPQSKKSIINRRHWHRWFAWFPVMVFTRERFPMEDGRIYYWAWLRFLERKWETDTLRRLNTAMKPGWDYRETEHG